MKVRNLRPGENWPDNLFMGFEGPTLDTQWCWVIEDDDASIKAGLMTCPMHGALFLLRMAEVIEAPNIAIHALLKEVFIEAKKRGLSGWITLTDAGTDTGRKLERLIAKAGGVQWPTPCNLSFGLFRSVRGV